MTTKAAYKTTFEVDEVIRPIYTGGAVALDNGSRILATTLGEDAVLTDLATGKLFAKIEGDGESISTLILTPSASHLIVCSRSLAMRIYSLAVSEDLETVEPTLMRTLKPHATPAVVLAVDRTSTLLATGSADGNIKVWDIRGGYLTHTFRGPSVLVSALHFFEVAATSADAIDAVKDSKDSKKKSKKNKNTTVAETPIVADPSDTSARFRLASGSQDGKVRVWDLHKRTVIANLEGHVSDVQALDYSAAQNIFVTAGRDQTVTWWDAKTWTVRRVVPTFELIEAAGFLAGSQDGEGSDSAANDGAVTYTAGANGCLRFWDTRTGREITKEQPARSEEESFIAALYRPAQSTLVCVQMDQTLAVYPVPSAHNLLQQVAAASSKTLSPLEAARRISGTHDDVIDLAYLLPDQSLMALGTNSEDVRIVSVADASKKDGSYFGQDVALLKGHSDIVVTLDVDWSGHWIATGAKDNSARLWRVDYDNSNGNKEYSCYAEFTGHAESVGAVALPKTIPSESSPAYQDPLNNPPPFLVTGSQDLTVKRWDIPRSAPEKKSGQLRALFTRKAHDKDINALDIDASGQLFASSSQDRTVKIYSAREGEVQGILRGHRRGVWSVKFAPLHTPSLTSDVGSVAGGSRGFVLTGSGDKTVKLWSLADYTCLRTFEGHTNTVLKVAWLGIGDVPDTSANDEDEDDEYMDLDDEDDEGAPRRRLPKSIPSRGPTPVLFASAGGDGLVKVWDATSGEATCTLDNHEDRVWALAVRNAPPAGSAGTSHNAKKLPRMLVSGGGDATVTFWRDTTASTASAEAEAAKERVEQEQQLSNHMRRGAYREALTLALQLNQPGRLLAVLSQVGDFGQDKGIDAALGSLTDDQLYTLLLRVRDWNTNGRTSTVAQRVLATIVRSYPAARLAGLAKRKRAGEDASTPGISSNVRGANIKDVLDALMAYTDRHYRRMADLLDESYLVDYTLQEMDALQGPAIAIAGEIEDVAMNE